jgi:hypothetical protein
VHPSPDASHKNQPKAANGPAHTSIPLHVYKHLHSITLARARALPILPSPYPPQRRRCSAVALCLSARACAPQSTGTAMPGIGSSQHRAPIVTYSPVTPQPGSSAATARTTRHRLSPIGSGSSLLARPGQDHQALTLGTSHRSAPAVDFPFCSTRSRSAAPRSNFSGKEHH